MPPLTLDREAGVADAEGELIADLVPHLGGRVGVDVGKHDHELVAAEPRDTRLASDRAP